jgi:nucleoside-diphosphate-sugar epimerase
MLAAKDVLADNAGQVLAGRRILVTGAAGFTGLALVRRLLSIGARVSAIVRPSHRSNPHLQGLDVSWHYGDVCDPSVVQSVMKGVEYVFHMASHFRNTAATDAMHVAVHGQSTQLLAHAACSSPVFKRFVHVSTVGVHGNIVRPPADENAPIAPEDIYQKTKADAEDWFRTFAVRTSLPFTILRPTPIFGPGDRRLLKLFRIATWPIVPVPTRGLCHYHLIYIDDLLDAMILSALHPKALGETFIIGNVEPIAIEEFISLVSRETRGRPARLIRVPFWPLRWGAVACETVCRHLGVKPLLSRRRIGFFVMNRWFNTSKAQTLLGFYPNHTNATGIQETARWYRQQGWV